jgi:ATP-dependent Lhr-like helicase
MPIQFVKEMPRREQSLNCLGWYVKEWFTKNFKELTPPQRYSFGLIAEGKNVLITAPTGSGKTLSAFTTILSELFKLGEKEELKDKVYCIYISPLRALSNDIKRNLMDPLEGIKAIAKEKGTSLPSIRIAIRTGDIPPNEKQKQLKNPPHILITTPESIAILLNSLKFVELLKEVKWVIIDEIHELANNKRGVHLSLSLERLCELKGGDFIRIGLGATLYPLEKAASYLVGYKNGKLRDCKVVDVSWFKPFDLQVKCPIKDLVHVPSDQLNKLMYELLEELISNHRTTLVFTNTRSGTERVVFHLKQTLGRKYGEEAIAAHHGSLSKAIRWEVEEKLKQGLMKAVICSTSLELGIDIGYIDLVAQISSPKSVTRAVQRIGRSGHKLLDVAKGRIIGMDRNDLIECAVMLKCAKERNLDKFHIPENCLDVLAQHLVGTGLTKKWEVAEAYRIIKRSHCYRNLPKEDLISLLHFLAGHYASLEDRAVYGKLWFDETEQRFGRRGKYTRVIYYLNSGTIPDEVAIKVYLVDKKTKIGSIEEGFLERLKPGDIFVLGGKTYEFRYARSMRAYVEAKADALPTIPAWFSELLPLSYELALEIGKFRAKAVSLLRKGERVEFEKLLDTFPIDQNAKQAVYQYFTLQWSYCQEIPTNKKVLIEETQDLKGRRHLVFHALFGRRVNDTLSRIFAILLAKQIGSNVGVVISDNGFSLLLPRQKPYSIKELFKELEQSEVDTLLKANLRRTELIKRRFRHCAARSFLILRNYKGHKISISRQQLGSQVLLNVCEEISKEFPVIKETYREILEDLMDLKTTKQIIERLKKGELGYKFIKTKVPSPFAHNLIVLGEADIILMKDRKERLLEMHEAILRELSPEELEAIYKL